MYIKSFARTELDIVFVSWNASFDREEFFLEDGL